MAVPGDSDSADKILEYDTVKRFANRAKSVRKDFELDNRTALAANSGGLGQRCSAIWITSAAP